MSDTTSLRGKGHDVLRDGCKSVRRCLRRERELNFVRGVTVPQLAAIR